MRILLTLAAALLCFAWAVQMEAYTKSSSSPAPDAGTASASGAAKSVSAPPRATRLPTRVATHTPTIDAAGY
jgi:hypothetical protein